MTRTVNPTDLAEMVSLAEQGFSRSEIAAMTDWSVQTVGKYVGHIVPRTDQVRDLDLARYRRMVIAAQGSSYGERDGIAKRFGLKNAKCLDVVLVKARRRVAEASRPSPIPTTPSRTGDGMLSARVGDLHKRGLT
jgi:hypothetical protein